MPYLTIKNCKLYLYIYIYVGTHTQLMGPHWQFCACLSDNAVQDFFLFRTVCCCSSAIFQMGQKGQPTENVTYGTPEQACEGCP